MQFKKGIWFLVSWLFMVAAHAQGSETILQLAFNKTSTVIFNTGILAVDRGSRDVMAQRVKGMENVLQLKASRRGFPETNLTVITRDGQVHEFAVNYSPDPPKLIMEINAGQSNDKAISGIVSENFSASELRTNAGKIVNDDAVRYMTSVHRNAMWLSLEDVYVDKNVIYYRIGLTNNSSINYDVGYTRWSVRDRRTAKRTASQEIGVVPVYVHGDNPVIAAKTECTVVYAMEKFTIPNTKMLVLEVQEKNGGRNLQLRINSRKLMRAKIITPR